MLYAVGTLMQRATVLSVQYPAERAVFVTSHLCEISYGTPIHGCGNGGDDVCVRPSRAEYRCSLIMKIGQYTDYRYILILSSENKSKIVLPALLYERSWTRGNEQKLVPV